MADSLNLSDAILIQRLDTTSDKPEMYATTLGQFSNFVSLNSDAIIQELSDKVDENSAELAALKDSIAVVVGTVTDLASKVYSHDLDINSIKTRLDKQEEKTSALDTRAKVHLFYKWIKDLTNDDPRNLQPGEMWVDGTTKDDMLNIWYSTVDEDGTPVGQPYIFENETLELTSMYDATPSIQSKLRHRSIHLVQEVVLGSDIFVRVKVKTLHVFNDGQPPYYEEDAPQPSMTRSDFYPIAADLDSYKEYVKETYLALNGNKAMSGDLRINKNTPGIQLQPLDGSDAKINSTGTLHLLYGNNYRIEMNEDEVVLHTDIDMGGNEIKNVRIPRHDDSAATKKFVEDAIDAINLDDLEIEGVFRPGEQVAKFQSSGVETGGFYIVNNTLYVRMP